MNKRIIQFLEDIMSKKDISCASLAQLTGIAYGGSDGLCMERGTQRKRTALYLPGSGGKAERAYGIIGQRQSGKKDYGR